MAEAYLEVLDFTALCYTLAQCPKSKVHPGLATIFLSQDHLEFGVSIVPVPDVLVIFALSLVAVDLCTV